jgi:hypothetical protein
MDVGEALVARAESAAKRSIVVVGTGKNVGKTVTVTAIAGALARRGTTFGVCSIGRDGEAVDAIDGAAKPRIVLRTGALLATAAALLPRHPAVELIDATGETSALGPIVVARVHAPGSFELAGPPSATAMRRVVACLFSAGAHIVLVDGAIDRIAAIAPGDAIVVATGAAVAPTPARVIDDAAALVACLQLPPPDPARDAIEIEGALTMAAVADLVRSGDRRQVVVHDATRIVSGARALAAHSVRLDLRCRVALAPVACTVAPMGGGRSFEPAGLLRGLATAVGLPCYNVFAGTSA